MARASSNKQVFPIRILDRLFIGGLLVIFGLIVLHAPLTVLVGTLVPDHALVIKAWKELLMGGLLVLAAVNVTRCRRWRDFVRDPLIITCAALAVLYMVSFGYGHGLKPYGAGLLIDLRYVLYAVLVYVAARLYPGVRGPFVRVGLIGACIVIGFAMLQFVLPKDFLGILRYSKATITPYTTIDDYEGLVRLQSTLRGPNPLGAYALIVAVMAAAGVATLRRVRIPLAVLSVASLVAVFASYSRSAYLGVILGLAIIGAVVFRRVLTARRVVVAGLVVATVLAGGFFAIRQTTFYDSVITHEVAGSGPAINSNDGHDASLRAGWARVVSHPLGYGTGSTGSASLLGSDGYIVENQYLYVAHEAGWAGLILFMGIIAILLWRSWRARRDPLALGVFASGIGLLAVGLVLPVFADDTVSIVWFGLAGLVAGERAVRGERTAE